jgi:excisionase family DNA binding protein
MTEPRTAQWLTQQQAADRLQVHLRTIERARADGRLTTYRAGRERALRFRVEDVDALMEPEQPDPPASSSTTN